MSTLCRSHLTTKYRKELTDIYKYAIEAVKPDVLVRNAIKIENNHLIVLDPINKHVTPTRYDLEQNQLHVIGGGKCVLNMAKGLADIALKSGCDTRKFSHGCLSLPKGLKSYLEEDKNSVSSLKSLDIGTLYGSANNLPDEESIIASQAILDHITKATNEDRANNVRSLFIVLISGGGSACLTSPKYISLGQKLKLITDLVQNGADIIELNRVRRYFSHIKGGQLAQHILGNNPNSRIISLLMSDVIGDPVEFIASGPTFIGHNQSGNHHESMLNVLEKYHLGLPADIGMTQTGSQLAANFSNSSIINRIIGSNRIALEAATILALELGYTVDCLGYDLHGSTQTILDKILNHNLAHATTGDKFLIIGGGEATVERLEGETWGKGGRLQEMAIDYMMRRLSEHPNGDMNHSILDYLLVGSTDGQDGPTDVAGCLVSASDVHNINLDELKAAKKSHDSHNFFINKRPDWLIKTGLTGTNVMDVFLHLRVDVRND